MIISLALFLTGFVMWPAFQNGYDAGIKPLPANEISIEQAFERSSQPFRATGVATETIEAHVGPSGRPR